ncbi:CatB-related O-acetyltransferase [Phenylobacterium sp.]|uniref:CatB-related O-acetyltransferase n=1 Tax=Phenylobacterium sp. TaxID=1871053 RepID=UPI0027310ED3|nr:CatB-related O-acetyltransferase [Phenylobacterium sp.]MDP1600756.1 CatB-related O-acetyltransferase [Phenylobacterium sp.]MDP3593912.1 CatB-related O-acetyltransferase [Phenylobacterium sp.]
MRAVRITRPLLDLFTARRIYHRVHAGERWRVGQQIGVDERCEIEPYVTFASGDVIPKAVGAFSYTHSSLQSDVSVGRYCSIAAGLSFFGAAHPLDRVTSSPTTFDPPQSALRFISGYLADYGITDYPSFPFEHRPAPVTIGHDVWIGAQAMIAGGVVVGHGAVIGARSVVTKDVPPYAIVVGSPARTVRFRFPEATIARLLALQWWRFGPEVIQRLDPLDLDRFLDAAEAELPTALDLRPLTFAEIVEASRRE